MDSHHERGSGRFKDYAIVKDFRIFKNDTPARNLLILNKDNFRGGLDRVQITIMTIEKIQEIITEELGDFRSHK